MASTSELDAKEELTQMVRECVRNEIALQRSGNSTSLLMRTRDLIASSARSASREMTNSIAPDFPATGTPGQPGTSSSSSFQTGQSQYFQTGKKRPAATTNHPWRLKGKQKKQTKQEFHPKAVHLLDKPEDLDENGFVPDYTVTDDMVLLKGYFELGTGQSESEIRESITEVLKHRFPFVRPEHFDFVKRERNKVTTPVVNKSLEWNYKHVKELYGQGKLYIRLNVLREIIDACEEPSPTGTKDDDDDDLMRSPFSLTMPKKFESSTGNGSIAEYGQSETSLTSMGVSASGYGASTSADLVVASIAGPSSQSDKETLRELLPSASDEQLDNALQEFGGLDSAADALLEGDSLQGDSNTAVCESIVQIIEILEKKLTGKRKKLEVDEGDLVQDAVVYYKSIQFDASCPLRITYQGQPAIDSGGVMRQFYSDLFEGLVEGKLMVLFEGENAHKVPSYQPQAVMSGMFEMVGKMIAHSLVQGGPGFPCLALPCFYYLVTGDVMCAFAYCDVWDIPDPFSRNIVMQVNAQYIMSLFLG